MITITRWHEICAGHRVYGHESVCSRLHGHQYQFHFTLAADTLDAVGRVLDFSSLRTRLCDWLEHNWDHRFLIYERDPWLPVLQHLDINSVVVLPVNPTAENLAQYLLREVGPRQLPDFCKLIRVRVNETRKCSAEASLDEPTCADGSGIDLMG